MIIEFKGHKLDVFAQIETQHITTVEIEEIYWRSSKHNVECKNLILDMLSDADRLELDNLIIKTIQEEQ
jgi:hypothetical protein